MGNILSCCQKTSASPSASPNASPSPGWHSVSVNQVIDVSDVYEAGVNSVAVPPATAVLELAELDYLDLEEGQPVLRMSDLKMPTEMDLERIPSDHPRASTIFLKKSQKDVGGKNKKNYSYHVSPGLLHEKHSSCSTIFLDESTMSQPSDRITVQSLVLAIYYHIKKRDANRSKDIFEEQLHPFTGETDPKQYFHRSPDPESIYSFIRPLFNAFHLTGAFAITTLVYLERLVIYAEIDIGPTNWKRVVLGAILLASKYLSDLAIRNVYFCRVIKGITLKDLNELERQYIYLLQFNLYVSTSVYAKYYFDLRTLAGDHGLPIAFAPLRKERAQKLEEAELECLEREFAIQSQITEAASCLASDPSVSKKLKKQWKTFYLNALKKLQEIENAINENRIKSGKKPTQRASLIINDGNIGSEDTSLSDALVLEDVPGTNFKGN